MQKDPSKEGVVSMESGWNPRVALQCLRKEILSEIGDLRTSISGQLEDLKRELSQFKASRNPSEAVEGDASLSPTQRMYADHPDEYVETIRPPSSTDDSIPTQNFGVFESSPPDYQGTQPFNILGCQA